MADTHDIEEWVRDGRILSVHVDRRMQTVEASIELFRQLLSDAGFKAEEG